MTRRKALSDPNSFTSHFNVAIPPLPTTSRDYAALCFYGDVWAFSLSERETMVQHLQQEIELGLRSRDMDLYRQLVGEYQVAQSEFRELEKEVSCVSAF